MEAYSQRAGCFGTRAHLDEDARRAVFASVVLWFVTYKSDYVSLICAQDNCRGAKNDPLAAITVPSLAKVEEYKQLVATKFPALTNVCAAMDGIKTPIQQV